jgi:hypothetical protein
VRESRFAVRNRNKVYRNQRKLSRAAGTIQPIDFIAVAEEEGFEPPRPFRV